MPRQARVAPGGWVYHVINRTVGRYHMFRQEGDFAAFERIMLQAHERHPLRILGWCLMGNHWHFVVWPKDDGQVSGFFGWLSLTHAVRWRVSHGTVGYGHLYRGRFKSFPIQRDEHLLQVLRYVERNALSAGLAEQAEDWRWGSLWTREHGTEPMKGLLSDWPVERPSDWKQWVNQPITGKELERLAISEFRGRPYGDDAWITRTAAGLGLAHTVRREGRPRKAEESHV